MSRLSWAIFWALAGTLTIIASLFYVGTFSEFARAFRGPVFLASSGVVLFLLGVTLIFLTVKEKAGGMLRTFLILTGAAAAAIPVSFILHNAVYAIFIHWFGVDFWDRVGLGNEPFFFSIAILVCPAAFGVGLVGSIFLAMRRSA